MRPITDAHPAELRRGGFWFLSSPYTLYEGGIDAAYIAACEAAGALLADGITVFSPIAHGHAIETESGISLRYEAWMRHCRPFLFAAHGVILLTLKGWDTSDGVGRELTVAEERNMPLFYMEPVQE